MRARNISYKSAGIAFSVGWIKFTVVVIWQIKTNFFNIRLYEIPAAGFLNRFFIQSEKNNKIFDFHWRNLCMSFGIITHVSSWIDWFLENWHNELQRNFVNFTWSQRWSLARSLYAFFFLKKFQYFRGIYTYTEFIFYRVWGATLKQKQDVIFRVQ